PRVRREACPVQFLGGIGVGWRMAWRVNLRPFSIDLTPECRAPCEVKFIERAVPFFEPYAKSSSGVIAKTFADMTAIFIVHMQHGKSGMIFIAFSQLQGNARGIMMIIRIMWAIVSARTMP